jgi:hypothetical protein
MTKKKKVIALTIDPDLHEFFKKYAQSRKKTVSGLFSEHIFDLSSSIATAELRGV